MQKASMPVEVLVLLLGGSLRGLLHLVAPTGPTVAPLHPRQHLHQCSLPSVFCCLRPIHILHHRRPHPPCHQSPLSLSLSASLSSSQMSAVFVLSILRKAASPPSCGLPSMRQSTWDDHSQISHPTIREPF